MATMTQTRTAAQGMCRRVSSPAAAAAVQELVGKSVAATGRNSASPSRGEGDGKEERRKTEIGVDITRRSSDESNDGSHRWAPCARRGPCVWSRRLAAM